MFLGGSTDVPYLTFLTFDFLHLTSYFLLLPSYVETPLSPPNRGLTRLTSESCRHPVNPIIFPYPSNLPSTYYLLHILARHSARHAPAGSFLLHVTSLSFQKSPG